jgi:FAD/FMN-containing dehydrogenase
VTGGNAQAAVARSLASLLRGVLRFSSFFKPIRRSLGSTVHRGAARSDRRGLASLTGPEPRKRPSLVAKELQQVAGMLKRMRDKAAGDRRSDRMQLELVAIRGGAHNVAGRATVEGGLMIDLSSMRGIRVDVSRRAVQAQGGATWAELNRETQLHGLAVTGGVVSTTGVAGLTLGGGLGWLMSKYGLALDNLLSVELVTADGKEGVAPVTGPSSNTPPPMGSVCALPIGGGGNFGVATSFVDAVSLAHKLGLEAREARIRDTQGRARSVLGGSWYGR